MLGFKNEFILLTSLSIKLLLQVVLDVHMLLLLLLLLFLFHCLVPICGNCMLVNCSSLRMIMIKLLALEFYTILHKPTYYYLD